MKKLIVIATVAMMAFASNAAGFSWTTGATGNIFYDGTGEATLYSTDSKATLYLFVTAEGSGSTLRSSVFDDLKAGNAISGSYTSTGIDSASKVSPIAWEDEKQAGKKFDMFFASVIKDSDGNDQFMISSLKTSLAYGGTSAKTFNWTDITANTKAVKDPTVDGLQSKTAWYSAAPEPTSGLLMLLGFAGLALRRRRA